MARGKGKTTATRAARRTPRDPVAKEVERLDALAAKLRGQADAAAASIDTLRSNADVAEHAAKVLREGTS